MAGIGNGVAGFAPAAGQEPSADEHAKLDAIGFAALEFANPDNSPDEARNEDLRKLEPGTFAVLASGDMLVRPVGSERIMASYADLRGSEEVRARLAGIGYRPAVEETRAHLQSVFDAAVAAGSIPVMEAEYIAAEDVGSLEA